MSLSITSLQPADRCTVLVLRGVLDSMSAVDLRAAVSAAAARQPRPGQIAVDLQAVESVDDLGAGTLIVGSRICRDIGIDLLIRHPSALVRHLLGMADNPAGQHPRRGRAAIAAVHAASNDRHVEPQP